MESIPVKGYHHILQLLMIMVRKVIILVENYLATRKMKTVENSHSYAGTEKGVKKIMSNSKNSLVLSGDIS